MTERGDRDDDSLAALFAATRSPGDLTAHAYAMESEAAERYAELAEQMALHNNPAVAEVFREMARIGQTRAGTVARRASDDVTRHAPWEYHWLDPESPEEIPVSEVHNAMTPHRALKLALHNEHRAQNFYDLLARRSASEEVRALAREFAQEEREHVARVRHWLDRYPEPEADWDDDAEALE